MDFIKDKRKMKNIIIEIIGIMLGAAIMAFGVSLFLLPNQLSSGGFSGIATLLYYLFKLPMGTTILVLNIPVFILSMFKIGKKYFIKSLIGTASLSIFIDFFEKFEPLTNDKVLACIYGGIIIGIGTAIVLKVNGSTGGSEMVSHLINYYNSEIRTGNAIVIIDAIIIALNVIFFKNLEVGLYSAIAIYLMGKMIDIIFEGIYFTKMIVIISSKGEEIAKGIEQNIQRGVTGLYGKGMYTNKDKLILICAAPRRDVGRLKEMVKQIDPHSFIIISNSREVLGEGFKRE